MSQTIFSRSRPLPDDLSRHRLRSLGEDGSSSRASDHALETERILLGHPKDTVPENHTGG